MGLEGGMHHRGIGSYSADDGSGVAMLDFLRYQVRGADGVVLCLFFCRRSGIVEPNRFPIHASSTVDAFVK
jgi:hypothetical protein